MPIDTVQQMPYKVSTKKIDTIAVENNFNNLDSWLEYFYSMAWYACYYFNQSKISDMSDDKKLFMAIMFCTVCIKVHRQMHT
jgi:hypothetical protein